MPAPVAAVVSAGRDVQLHLLAVVAQNTCERPGRIEKRIGVAYIEPDRSAAEHLPAATSREHVVTSEILCVVERTGRRLAAGAPESRRVAADRAEPVRSDAGQVERSETAHGDSADRHTLRIRALALQRQSDRFA
jgi:hypothetical protein